MGIVGGIMVPHPPLIIPEVGGGQEAAIAASTRACERASAFAAALKPDALAIISPHSVMYSDYIHISPGESARGDMARFGADGVRAEVKYDRELVDELADSAARAGLSAGTQGERDKRLDHGTLIPLYFLGKGFGGALPPIARISISGLSPEDHYRLGALLAKTAEKLGRRVCVVASGDMSHRLKSDGPYGFAEEGPEYDARAMDAMSRAAFGELLAISARLCEAAGECGHRAFLTLAGAFDGVGVKAERLSYEGPFGVGYGVCTFLPGAADSERRFLETRGDAFVRLARRALEHFVTTGSALPLPDSLPSELVARRAGAFVSLKKRGELRGCIGTIAATRPTLAEEIIYNAISACSEDPRFPPVRPEELGVISVSVDVLGEPEKIASEAELDPKRYGVIVTSGFRRGLLLPNLEGVDTVRRQVAIAKRKAGLSESARVDMMRFEVERHA